MLKIFNSRNLLKISNVIKKKKTLVRDVKEKSVRNQQKKNFLMQPTLEALNKGEIESSKKTKIEESHQGGSEGKKKNKEKSAHEAHVTDNKSCQETTNVNNVFFLKSDIIHDYLNKKCAVYTWNE
jgi:hypothetical protein